MKKFKSFLRKNFLLWVLLLLVIKPKRFMNEYVLTLIDYSKFLKSLKWYKVLLNKPNSTLDLNQKPGLLIMAGKAMDILWLQVWVVFGAFYQAKGYRVFAITSRENPIQNLYLKIFGFNLLFLEDMYIETIDIPLSVSVEVRKLRTFRDFKEYESLGIPLGKMALSTFSRQRATGIMDVSDPQERHEIGFWIEYLYKCMVVAERLYFEKNISLLFFTEVFMEEYGAFYYAALSKDLNIIRFAGTVRDDAIVVQHLNPESDRTHFSSIEKKNWIKILGYPKSDTVYKELEENFADRYGDRWALSTRNQPNTKVMLPMDARKLLNVSSQEKIAVIYSHILYDTLFFNGEDIFENYADWLVQTVRAACKNNKVRWFIKVHPSNLWRGELEHYHKGKYEEVRLIEKFIGNLPSHVKIIYPDTPISPYTWLQIADFGVTVRGTSGIELGALGKTVITAGSGRYEEIGFTINSNSVDEYLNVLAKIPNVPKPNSHQHEVARRFAYATFCMKPFTLDFLRPSIRAGKKRIFNSHDLVYFGKFTEIDSSFPDSMERFYCWSLDKNSIDFLNSWPNS